MLFSKMFAVSLKESPKDAQLKSHIYLLRAGYIQQVGSGIYNFLPLGKKVLDSVRAIIKEEMDKAGAQEVLLGFVTPAELWRTSGRFEQYGKELLRFKDRKENDFVLGPTHEEMVTSLAKAFVKSYKQLPLNLYQIHTKFRDEARPRFGLLRAREFIMKDAYSFHANFEDLDREFANMEHAYRAILERLGLEYKVVEADSGAIGGSGSKEFMVLSPSGEDTLVVCKKCQYAANIEAATRKPKSAPRQKVELENLETKSAFDEGLDELLNAQKSLRALESSFSTDTPQAGFSEFFTPNIKSIESLCEFFKIHPFYTMKCVAKKARYEEIDENKKAQKGAPNAVQSDEIVLYFMRGDDFLEETKALNVLNKITPTRRYLDFSELDSQDLNALGLFEGFIGALGLNAHFKCIFDESLKGAKNLICGANKKDYHLVGVDLDEFEEFKDVEFADIISVQSGDLCPHCGNVLGYTKGIEVGHIFKLGRKYSQSLEATFLNPQGKTEALVMGCYGIGVTRLLPAILEQKSDEFGCVWGEGVKVFEVVIIISNTKDSKQLAFAQTLYDALLARGVDVLLDDRNERFGFKMKDFELLGIYQAVVVGKELAQGKVERILREGLKKELIACEECEQVVLDSLQKA